ncbi:GGDEF domain-containing protein [Loktanella sp. Alg231-35]|uniref:GGDEF domain-containing protein n=1 Tax=Loktanella sp. Alg231-35 TaxID=1922220 RepID=UPI00131F1A7B|nr:diguanylate cyclase [Loktanella sp. Alg231-35]
MSLAFLFNVVLRRFHGTRYEAPAFGTLFGIAIVVGMINPLSLGEGLIFDTRTLLLGAATTFAGPVAGVVALVFGVICRLVLGGAGVTSGVVGLLTAFGLALAFERYLRSKISYPAVGDVALGAVITLSIGAIFLIPFDIALGLFLEIAPVLLICNVVGIAVIGMVFRREKRYFEATKALEEHARRDPLTNLLNRRGLDAHVGESRFDAQNGHAFFFFDIDNFIRINDSYGHDAGDATLAIIAARLRNSLREEAIFARHGGDEFSIYLPSVNAADVEGIAERLCGLVSDKPVERGGTSFDVSISMGVFWSRVHCPLQEMINQADTQLMMAKNKGKNRAQVTYSAEGVNALAA